MHSVTRETDQGLTLATDSRVFFFVCRLARCPLEGPDGERRLTSLSLRCATQKGAVMTCNKDLRREQLEQIADVGDECATAELWQVYGVDRRASVS